MVNNHYKCKSSRLKNYYYFYYHFYSTTTLLLSLGKPYPANKALLMQHSGYFRTVLSPSMTSLVLPTVPSEVFGLLWTSMASNSVLNINEANVYQLLLYGQLLQMPGVILQCKAYLANLGQQQQPQEQPPMPNITSTIVRPIPNKIQLWKPWMYSASLYQDWLARYKSEIP